MVAMRITRPMVTSPELPPFLNLHKYTNIEIDLVSGYLA